MNKSAQFTPGPWVVKSTDEDINTKTIVDGNEFWIARVLNFNHASDDIRESQANAALIAAAPAMYEALQNLLEWAKGNREAREGNPYCKPEVRQALKVLASIQGKKDYLDAETAPQAEGRHPRKEETCE